jgi:hypothetical protein
MKKPRTNPLEKRCTACNGTGHLEAVRPVKPTLRIYPPQCKICLGKGRVAIVSDSIRLHPKQRNTLIRGLDPIAGSLPTGCISAWQFSHSRVFRTC